MIRKRHFKYTRSRRADDVLRKWDTYAPKFVKVFPRDLTSRALDATWIAAESGQWLIRPGLPQALPRVHVATATVEDRLQDWTDTSRRTLQPRSRCGSRRLSLHGLRNPVLQRRLPPGQHHPGLQRPGLSATSGKTPWSGSTATNNFPGVHRAWSVRLPASQACVLGINQDPVTIKQVEWEIVRQGLGRGLDPSGPGRAPHGALGGGGGIGPGGAGGCPAAVLARATR